MEIALQTWPARENFEEWESCIQWCSSRRPPSLSHVAKGIACFVIKLLQLLTRVYSTVAA